MKCVNIIVSGRVQGVYFRAFTQKQANKLGITGYVRNTLEGTVEIIACAEQEKLDAFISWCHKGPIMAKVSDVMVTELVVTEVFNQFDIR